MKRRQDSLRGEGIMLSEHLGKQAGLDLASEMIQNYLGRAEAPASNRTPIRKRRATMPARLPDARDHDTSDSESEGLSSDVEFYPSKRARRLDSMASPSQPRSADISRLLGLESSRGQLLEKQRELLALEAENTRRAREVLEKLEKEYTKHRSLLTMTEADFEDRIPDLQHRLDAGLACSVSSSHTSLRDSFSQNASPDERSGARRTRKANSGALSDLQREEGEAKPDKGFVRSLNLVSRKHILR
ncbi:hypothetical protein C8R44DRAFT_980732, partial [Mycena epipterygia]